MNKNKIIYVLSIVCGALPLALALFLPLFNAEVDGNFNLIRIIEDVSTKGTFASIVAIIFVVFSLLLVVAGTLGFFDFKAPFFSKDENKSLVAYIFAICAALSLVALIFIMDHVFASSDLFQGNISMAFGLYIVMSINIALLIAISVFYVRLVNSYK